MSNIIIGILLLITLVGLIVYAVKGKNLMVGFLVITTIWLALVLIGNAISPNAAMADKSIIDIIGNVFQAGPEGYAKSILVNIFFGAFFGRVLIDTGIASTLIRKVVELGGDKPKITMILLSIVVLLCFTSMTGIGPVIAIAVIALQILQALGIPSDISLFSFMGSIMCGILSNITNFKQYQGILDGMAPGQYADPAYTFQTYFSFGVIASIIAFVIIMFVSCRAISKRNKSHAWAAVTPNSQPAADAPVYSWISVILPVLLVVLLKLQVIPAFLLSSLFALLTCGKLKGGYDKVAQMISKLFTDGSVDVAPMIGFLLMLAMFNNVAVYAGTYFQAVIGGIFPSSAFALTILMAVLIPAGFFRGPTNLVGCGTAIAVVILGVAADLPVTFLYPMFAIATIVPQHLDITQSWVAWGLGYTKVGSKDFMKFTIPTGWVIGAILMFVNYFMNGIAA
jgi:H+/gluconate symporter-like permease